MSLIHSATNTEIAIKSESNSKVVTIMETSGKNGNALNRNIRLERVRSTASMLAPSGLNKSWYLLCRHKRGGKGIKSGIRNHC